MEFRSYPDKQTHSATYELKTPLPYALSADLEVEITIVTKSMSAGPGSCFIVLTCQSFPPMRLCLFGTNNLQFLQSWNFFGCACLSDTAIDPNRSAVLVYLLAHTLHMLVAKQDIRAFKFH